MNSNSLWDYRLLHRMDYRILPVIISLMLIGLMVISAFSIDHSLGPSEEGFFTPMVSKQIRFYLLGFGLYFFFAGFDYNKLREWTWILYGLMILALVGLFFTDAIQRVHRWYRIPLLNFSFQPSEYAKLIVVITLSWFMERHKERAGALSTAIYGGIIVGIPFLLILKQPDLGTALVLFPITLVMFYFGDIYPPIIKAMLWIGAAVLMLTILILMGYLSHEELRPYATKFLKDYQYDRISPDVHHQKAAATAIAVGGLTGTGWRKSEYTGGGWLPMPYTDSVFPSFGEEFGFLGLTVLMFLFYALIYLSVQVSAVAKDHFGRLLAAGISIYLAMHVIVNTGMMVGFLPITGVPLVLVTYGGSSILATMTALGILQSIYTRRFMF
jgi:rod shape determining protein RodA